MKSIVVEPATSRIWKLHGHVVLASFMALATLHVFKIGTVLIRLMTPTLARH